MVALADLIRFRDDLLNARFSGVRRLRDQNGEEIEYRSDAELARAVAAVNAEIRAATAKPPNTIYFRTSKGV